MGGGCTSSDGPSLSLSVKQVTSKILDGGVPGRKTKTGEFEVTEPPLSAQAALWGVELS